MFPPNNVSGVATAPLPPPPPPPQDRRLCSDPWQEHMNLRGDSFVVVRSASLLLTLPLPDTHGILLP